MNRKHEKPIRMTLVVPAVLKERLVQRAGKETIDTGQTVTPSEIMRAAVEEYLDLYEGATFVKEAQA